LADEPVVLKGSFAPMSIVHLPLRGAEKDVIVYVAQPSGSPASMNSRLASQLAT
jgi:hypothetical protein